MVEHFKRAHANVKFTCRPCNAVFKSPETFQRHLRRFHTDTLSEFGCAYCSKLFQFKKDRNEHEREKHGARDIGFILVKSALSNNIKQYTASFDSGKLLTLSAAVKKTLPSLKRIVHFEFSAYPSWRCGLVVNARFLKESSDRPALLEIFPLRTKSRILLQSDMARVKEIFRAYFAEIEERIEQVCGEESGWVMRDIASIDLELAKVDTLSGSSMAPAAIERLKNKTENMAMHSRLRFIC